MSDYFSPDGQPQPEFLEQGGGAPARTGSRGGGRRTALVGGAVAVAAVVVGGGIWAATSFFGSGPQPAEALPGSTLGYASIDLDPSGSQKIAALETLRKFPALKDKLGLKTVDDVRRTIFDELKKGADCQGLDYSADIEPWLGDRAAIAAVDTGEDKPATVVVVQVKDAGKADAALTRIRDCAAHTASDGGSVGPSGGWAIEGDWALIAESDAVARQVADATRKSSLADDPDYQKWTHEVGDAGIVNLYAAPEAGRFMADNLGGFFGGSATASAESCTPTPATPGKSGATCLAGGTADSTGSSSNVPTGMTDALRDFKGMAATVRFDNGALELEVAGDPGKSQQALYNTDRGDDVLATLPEDTAAAVGVGFAEGWFSTLVEQLAASSGGQTTAAKLMTELSNQSGLDLPADAETLAGSSAAVSVGSDFDISTIVSGSDPGRIPVALKVKGQPDAISSVLDKLRGQMGTQGADLLGSDSSGDLVAIGPDAAYRSQVLEDGKLGDTKLFQDVVREAAGAGTVLFVNFDAGDWLVHAAGNDQKTADNLRPLAGLGISAWQKDGAGHAVLRLTTN